MKKRDGHVHFGTAVEYLDRLRQRPGMTADFVPNMVDEHQLRVVDSESSRCSYTRVVIRGVGFMTVILGTVGADWTSDAAS